MGNQLPVLLRMVRREPEPGEPESFEPEPEADAPAPEEPQRVPAMLPGAQMTFPDQARAVLSHAWAVLRLRMRTLRAKKTGLIHMLRTGKPPSIEEHLAYGDSRAWVPRGHEGGIFETVGVAWNRWPGLFGVALGNWISSTSHKPYRAQITFLLSYVISAGALYAFGQHGVAIWMAASLLLVAVIAGIAIAVAPAHAAARQQDDDDREDDDYEGES